MRSLLSALAWTLLVLMADGDAASAQQPGRVYRIGYLWIGRPDFVPQPFEQWTGPGATFRDVLRDAGFVSGKNLVVDYRHAQGDVGRLEAEAQSLVASGVDVLVPGGTAPTAAAIRATKRIPIVFDGVGSPVEKGFVASLANPGGNVTGIAVGINGPKLWQFLRDIAPATRRGGALIYAPNNYANAVDPAYRAKARERIGADAAAAGVEFVDLNVDTLEEIESRFAELGNGGGAGVVVYTDSTLFAWRSSIVEMVLRHRLPTVCLQWLGWAEAGCLVTYGEDFHAIARGSATMVAKVLKGLKPADIPVEQPTHFKLIINLRTAKALDLTVPPSLLAQADEIIE